MLTLLLIGMLTSAFYVNPVKSTEDNWWNSEWVYRRRVNITENSGYSLTNFPVEVSFNHNGHAQPDGKDIRVIDDLVEIPSYVEECNNTHAKVVFEINLSALQTKTLYIYYGNPNATPPNYPLVSLTISEGNNGYAIIDNLVYIGWNNMSWGWSNPVELWNDFRIDFDGDESLMDESDLIRDWAGMGSTRMGGIGRHRKDIEAIGLGDYLGFIQTSIYVEIKFANASLKVYRKNSWVETVQADVLWMFSPSYDYAKYSGGVEENVIDGLNTNGPPNDPLWNIIYNSSVNPLWMAFKDSVNGYILSGIAHNIGSNYSYVLSAKEANDFDRCIIFEIWDPIYYPLNPFDHPSDCRIYWCADNSNGYSKIEAVAQMLNNQPSTVVGLEETTPAPPPPLTVSISPTSASILVGQSVTFTSTVSGGYTPYTYQWYLNGNPVSGATADTWTFTPTESGIFYVYVKVTDDKGDTAQSETARITVSAVPVGGYSIPINVPMTTTKPVTPYIALLTILTAILITIKRKRKRKH